MIIEEMLGESKHSQQERRDVWIGMGKALVVQYDEHCEMLTSLQMQNDFILEDLIKVSVRDDLNRWNFTSFKTLTDKMILIFVEC